MLVTKANQKEISRMDLRLDEMPNKKEVAQVRTDLFDVIENFTKDNLQFKTEFII